MVNARRAADLATERYRSGIVSYIEVVNTDRDTLTAERANAQLAGQRLVAAVQLLKALGGGWDRQPAFAAASMATFKPATGDQK